MRNDGGRARRGVGIGRRSGHGADNQVRAADRRGHLRGPSARPPRQARRHGRVPDVLATGRLLRAARAGPGPVRSAPSSSRALPRATRWSSRSSRSAPNRSTAVSFVRPEGLSAAGRRQPDAHAQRPAADTPLRVAAGPASATPAASTCPTRASRRIEIPLRPMLGRVAVAPAGEEAWGGLWPGTFGGNMDASDVREGSTVFLPVFHEARCSISATCTRRRATAKSAGRAWRRRWTCRSSSGSSRAGRSCGPGSRTPSTSWSPAASARSSTRSASPTSSSSSGCVSDYGFEKMEAYQVVSQAGSARIANVVDPLYTVVAKFPKALFAESGSAWAARRPTDRRGRRGESEHNPGASSVKTIGLIGGMSWESTVPYYQTINRVVGRRLGGLHSAKIALYSVDFDEIERLQHEGRWEAVRRTAGGGRPRRPAGGRRRDRVVHEHDAQGRRADRGGGGRAAPAHRRRDGRAREGGRRDARRVARARGSRWRRTSIVAAWRRGTGSPC